MLTQQRILILDFGSQYTMLIARRVRELQIYCEIWPFSRPLAQIAAWQPGGLILSGGPSSVYDEGAPQVHDIFDLDVPILGICYGMQLMAQRLGGTVAPGHQREYGQQNVEITAQSPLLAGLDSAQPHTVWMSHGDCVTQLPTGFEVLARSADGLNAAIGHPKKRHFGLQFHPEVAHTQGGLQLLRNFAVNICGCAQGWTMSGFVSTAVAAIRQQVGDGRVLCGLSGGVDSSVTAALLHLAIGDRLTCVFVDNGLLRLEEAHDVRRIFGDGLKLPLISVDAGARFLAALQDVVDPEQKRKIIGKLFIEIFEETALATGQHFEFLAQGTLYPDVIESVSVHGSSAMIKSHHNVGGLPERMRMKLVEPLRELFKDEVRAVGRELGMPSNLVDRQPFPGPGMAVRIVGDITPKRVDLVQRADAIVRQELDNWSGSRELWQYFAVLLPVQSVGVMGDKRTYEATAVVRAVQSTDGMTADWADIPKAILGRISSRIINEVRGINRVVYDISSKPPATVEWE